eukprot:SAG11_NODE_2111_length_3809_cov_11.810322_1_plen_226_part_10
MFSKVMALPSAEGQSWRLQVMEELVQLWKVKKRKVQEVFAGSGRGGHGIFTAPELHGVLKKLGLVLSTQKAHELHRLIDKNNSGGVSMDDLIAWVHGAPHESSLQAFRETIGQLIQLHLGSTENGFLFFRKKLGFKGLQLTAAQFAAGVRYLLEWDRNAAVWADEDLAAHFNKAGGRNDLLTYANFMRYLWYFTPNGGQTAETELPRPVKFLAMSRLEIANGMPVM